MRFNKWFKENEFAIIEFVFSSGISALLVYALIELLKAGSK